MKLLKWLLYIYLLIPHFVNAQSDFIKISKHRDISIINKTVNQEFGLSSNIKFEKIEVKKSFFSKYFSLTDLKIKESKLSYNHFVDFSVFRCDIPKYHEDNNLFSGVATYDNFCFKEAYFTSDTFYKTSINSFKGQNIQFDNCVFKDLTVFTNLDVNNLTIIFSTINSKFTVESSPNLKQISIYNTSVSGDAIMDFSNIKIASGNECLLIIDNANIPKTKLNYVNFKLNKDTANFSDSYIMSTYELLLRSQKDYGFNDGYKKLDIEYHNFKLSKFWNVQDYFSKIWWNYGYNKEYIFSWTLIFFFIFFGVIFFFFQLFIDEVYTIENLKKRWDDEKVCKPIFLKKLWYRLCLAFLYCCILFFGIKLDVDKLKFNSLKGVVFIYVFYLIGVVCVVFIGNYVLLK